MTPQPPFLLLKAVPAFRYLANDDLRALYGAAHTVSMASGEKLAEQGAPVEALNIVMSGRLVALAEDNWGPIEEVAEAIFQPGHAVDARQFFGHAHHPRHVAAARPSTVLRLSRADFREAMADMPAVWEKLLAGMAAGSVAPTPASADAHPAARTIALCPGAGGEVPTEFLKALTAALEQEGACQVLSSSGLGQDMPGGIALDDPEVAHQLEESERLNDIVLYVADRELTAWTRRCIDRADEVLIVGVDDGDPAGPQLPASEVEKCGLAMAGARASRLAIVTGRAPLGIVTSADRWLRPRAVRSHHFVTLGDRGSFSRLARFLTGRANALALSGSGVAGAAHLGVMTALTDSGVPIDAIGGTGAGAAVGALVALGLRPADIDQTAADLFVGSGVLNAGWLNFAGSRTRLGLYGHRRYDRLIAGLIPAGTAADLRLPFRAFSANVSRCAIREHDRDSLQAIIRTNWTPPGVFAPFVTGDGNMLADGSGLAPPPVDRLRALGVNRCFVVQPLPGPLGAAPAAYRDLQRLTSRAAFRRVAKREDGELPAVTDVVVRSRTPRWFAREDLPGDLAVFHPPLPRGVSVLDFAKHARIMALAHDWAMNEIAQLRRAGDPLFEAQPAAEPDAARQKRG